MSAVFEKAIEFVLKYEGGYVNDPNDPGGETNYGISRKSFPDLDIKNLTIDQAKGIYFQRYWVETGCSSLPDPIAFLFFDGAVNQGPERTAKALQTALRVKVDGNIGSKTLEAVKTAYSKDPAALIDNLCAGRGLFYMLVSEKLEPIYGFGWMRRLFSAHRQAILIHKLSG